MSKACVYSSKFMAAAAADRSSFIHLIFIFYDVCRGDVHTLVCTYVATKGIQTSTNVVRYPFLPVRFCSCVYGRQILLSRLVGRNALMRTEFKHQFQPELPNLAVVSKNWRRLAKQQRQ